MEDDMWRADGSFRGLAGGKGGGGGGGGGGGKKGNGGGPQFNRVIPKFLQKYHQGPQEPGISTKFEPAPQPPGEEDGAGVDELDDVQKAAIEEYLKKTEEKAGEKTADGEDAASRGNDEDKKKKSSEKQRVAAVGSANNVAQKKKTAKRKRASDEKAALSNKKLLSFSMDDEDA